MKVRIFKQMRKNSIVDHWKWTKSNGVEVKFKHRPHYEKSDYNLKELLREDNGESIIELN